MCVMLYRSTSSRTGAERLSTLKARSSAFGVAGSGPTDGAEEVAQPMTNRQFILQRAAALRILRYREAAGRSSAERLATASRQQHQRLVVPRADADGRKVTPVRGEHSRDAPALGHGREHAIDQTKLQLVELGIELG